MSDEYLWNKTGERDPGVEELERALGTLAHDGRALELPEAQTRAVPRREGMWSWTPRWVVAAAAIAAVVGLATWPTLRSGGASWTVTRLSGAPRVGIARMDSTARIAVGQWLVTDARSRARLEVGGIGEITLEPDSRLRLVRASAADHRLALQRGVLHALIFAPPRRFTIDTPAASAVDLGCAYTLEVANDGRSVVTVESGWVSFERDGREAFIPAGARSVTLKGGVPGTPYFTDADARLIRSLDAVDRAPRGDPDRDAALETVLANARREDAVTLWHLLARLDGDARAQVFSRLAELAPPPPGVSRAGVLRGDRAMLDAWWNSLGLGDVDWWRLWAQSPPERRR
jgi:hypothetical protein